MFMVVHVVNLWWCMGLIYMAKSVFGNVVAVAFQIAFRVKINANDFFYFLKIIFDISTSK